MFFIRSMVVAVSLLVGVAVAGCTGRDSGSNTDTSGLGGDDSGEGGGWHPGDDSGGAGGDPVDGRITGTLRLQLYRELADGAREYIDWAEVYDVYPFGSVFLAAYTQGPAGDLDYPGTTVVSREAIDLVDGNAYEIPVKMTAAAPVRVYASVDYLGDGILSSDEPIGVYPAEVEVEGADTIDSIDITVLMPYTDFNGGVEGSGTLDDLVPEACAGNELAVTGDVLLDRPYDGGAVAVMLLSAAGEGPVAHGWTVLQADEAEDNAAGSYSVQACANQGTVQLRGAWDSNSNLLIDPADLWGSYADEDGEDANPIVVGGSALAGYDVHIPLGEAGLSIIPFTEVRGTLRVDGGFDSLPSTTRAVYVVALKYQPDQDMSAAYLYERSYDVLELTPDDYEGKSSIDFALGVPSDSVLYLWGYADTDGDGAVNGPGEHVGSGGGSGGRILTTEGINDGNDITIGVVGG